MPRLTDEEWATARTRWEADPILSLRELAQQLGVTHGAVNKAAKRFEWVKVASDAAMLRDALLMADAVAAGVSIEEVKSSRGKASTDAALCIRAAVIERHRADWEQHRTEYPLGGIAADFELGKSAKISAEMLTLRQKGERAAHGLDAAHDEGIVIVNPRSWE